MTEVLWSTFPEFGTPHAWALEKFNPGVTAHVIHSDQSLPRATAWRNCDRATRDWWRLNHGRTTASHFLVIEGDVLWQYGGFPPTSDLSFRDVMTTASNPRWCWWSDLRKIPHRYHPYATGGGEFGIRMVSRRFLDAHVSSEFDELYDADVFCELRTPTVATFLGLPPTTFKLPGRIHWQPLPPPLEEVGVYHPVKWPTQKSLD